MMLSNLRKLTYNRYYKRLEVLLASHNGKSTLKSTISLLKNMESDFLDPQLTRLTDQIFFKDGHGLMKEQYKDLLKQKQRNWRKFEIKRLILDDQYELAVMNSLEGYHKEVDTCGDIHGLLMRLQFIKLLELASERSDTIILGQLLEILTQHNILTQSNFSNLLINAMNNKDIETTRKVLEHYKLEALSDNILLRIGELFIANNQTERIYEMITLMKSDQYKLRLSLSLVGSMPLDEAFKTLDILATSSGNKLYASLTYLSMPPTFYQIEETNNFEEINAYLKLYEELKNDNIKQILIECLLMSAGNLYTGFNVNMFVLNYLLKNGLELKSSYVSILCHNISKTNLKITTLTLLKLFEAKNINLTESNVFFLLNVFFSGTEFDLLYLMVIHILEQFKQLPLKIKEKLCIYHKITQDNNIEYLLTTDDPSILKFKEMINYTFIVKNMENQDERSKNIHSLLPGYFEYVYKLDIEMKNRLQ